MNGLMDVAYGYDAAGYYYKNFVDIGYEFAHSLILYVGVHCPYSSAESSPSGYFVN